MNSSPGLDSPAEPFTAQQELCPPIYYNQMKNQKDGAKIISSLKAFLHQRIEDISFTDNMYYDEDFFAKSIENNFAGWYDADALKQQIGFILQHCKVTPNSKVLDAACGHGRHAELLCRRGHEVLATDISDQLITHLTEKYGDKRLLFEKRTFMEINYSQIFDLAIVLANSLGLIPRDEFVIVLNKLSRSLKKDGWLFVELDNRSHFVKNEAGKRSWSYHADRWLVLSERHYDSENRLEKTVDISVDFADMSVNQFLLTKSLYDYNELCNLLASANFIVRKSFGDWEGNEISEASPSLLIVAQNRL